MSVSPPAPPYIFEVLFVLFSAMSSPPKHSTLMLLTREAGNDFCTSRHFRSQCSQWLP